MASVCAPHRRLTLSSSSSSLRLPCLSIVLRSSIFASATSLFAHPPEPHSRTHNAHRVETSQVQLVAHSQRGAHRRCITTSRPLFLVRPCLPLAKPRFASCSATPRVVSVPFPRLGPVLPFVTILIPFHHLRSRSSPYHSTLTLAPPYPLSSPTNDPLLGRQFSLSFATTPTITTPVSALFVSLLDKAI